ncbi:MAG: hypothetical protein JSS57_27160 [Proteobacteria bacterium]|nr:hypothetical protein [Pseudomonadota bacterium]
MLKVSIHTGDLNERSFANQLGVLDIAYAKQAALSDYAVAMSLRGSGELEPGLLQQYPRWASSLWDLTARALTRILYHADQAPSAGKPDRRCAYATRLCAVIERSTANDTGLELGTVEIRQIGRQRGLYVASFEEDILGSRVGEFEYGRKVLNPADLLLRAICWTYFGNDVLGPRPALILPPSIRMEGVDCFHIESLSEPARTGFRRFLAESDNACPASSLGGLSRAEDYVRFLMKG